MIIASNLRQQIKITYRTSGRAECRIGRKPFAFRLEITYVPKAWLIEFIEYDTEVRRLGNGEATTIEELAEKLLNMTFAKLQPIWLDLTLEAFTEVHGDTIVMMQKGEQR